MRVEVVDLPFVPVMPTTRPRRKREASSISETTGTPLSRAARISARGGTPGLGTMRSASRKDPGRWPPSSKTTPRSAKDRTLSPNASAGFLADPHPGPAAGEEPADGFPGPVEPTTRTFLSCSSISISASG